MTLLRSDNISIAGTQKHNKIVSVGEMRLQRSYEGAGLYACQNKNKKFKEFQGGSQSTSSTLATVYQLLAKDTLANETALDSKSGRLICF